VSTYEYSPVEIGGRDLNWEEYTVRTMGTWEGHLPYLEYHLFERDRRRDHAAVFGSYFIFDGWNFQPEIGFGMDTDFLYKFRASAAFERSIKGPLQAKFREQYLHYEANDVLVTSPGLIYYFRDHYLTADYNVSITEGRGDAHYASVQVHTFFRQRLHAYAGIAAGQRLFDIVPLEASKQKGLILFSGFDYRFFKNVKAGFDYSFGTEDNPEFRKHGFGGRISIAL
jgi:YaiO family outer membrane protein